MEQQQKSTIDYGNLFTSESDEFEGTAITFCNYLIEGTISDKLSKFGVDGPSVRAGYYSYEDESKNTFLIKYDIRFTLMDLQILELDYKLKDHDISSATRALMSEIGSPCKGLLIIIDNNETIKLFADNLGKENEDGITYFPISEADFLRCCNAKQLEFKVAKYNHDIIEVVFNNEDNQLLINSFRALYNYKRDNNEFSDSIDVIRAAIKRCEEKRKREEEEAKNKQIEERNRKQEKEKHKDRVLIGIGIGVVLLFLFIKFVLF